jgi:hypothetical protein
MRLRPYTVPPRSAFPSVKITLGTLSFQDCFGGGLVEEAEQRQRNATSPSPTVRVKGIHAFPSSASGSDLLVLESLFGHVSGETSSEVAEITRINLGGR